MLTYADSNWNILIWTRQHGVRPSSILDPETDILSLGSFLSKTQATSNVVILLGSRSGSLLRPKATFLTSNPFFILSSKLISR